MSNKKVKELEWIPEELYNQHYNLKTNFYLQTAPKQYSFSIKKLIITVSKGRVR